MNISDWPIFNLIRWNRIQPRNHPPDDYRTPPFPSLYWPIVVRAGAASYLYSYRDVWRFTLFWTLLIYGAVYLAASGYAVAMQRKDWKIAWVVPVVFALVGGLEAMLAGSVIGLMSVLSNLPLLWCPHWRRKGQILSINFFTNLERW